MEQELDSATSTLSLACQRLAGLVSALQQDQQRPDTARMRAVEELVTRALGSLEGSAPAASIAPATPKTTKSPKSNWTGLLLRMLRSGESADAEGSSKARSANEPPSDQHKLALRGEGSAVPVLDLIGFLSAQHLTGILDVVTPGEMFALELEAGNIVHAQSNHTPEGQRLGDILVSNGAIDRAALEVVRQGDAKGRLGEALVQRALVTNEQLLQALRAQIQLLFNRMFESPTTRFVFWSGPPIHADERVRLNTTALLLEGARASDESKWLSKMDD